MSRRPAVWGALAELARMSAGLPAFLRHPIEPAAAAQAVADRMQRRDAAFLEMAARLIYGLPASPWRRLLLWAGCAEGDLRRMVAADGVEATLEQLQRAGVFMNAGEMRGREPLRRAGLDLSVAAESLVNPLAAGAVRGMTSGTTAASSAPDDRRSAGRLPVRYSWDWIAAEAAGELLLLASHGLDAAPLALWMPAPPGIAGLHNVLAHAKLGRPPARWFSPSPAPMRRDGLSFWADRGWRLASRCLPALGPRAEWVPLDRAAEVAGWLAAAPRPAVLKCFASAAARVAEAVLAAGLEVGGQVVFAGGEPLGAARRRRLAAAGLQVFGRYAATETGFMAGACPHCDAASDEMHLYCDRFAVIQGSSDGGTGGDRHAGGDRGERGDRGDRGDRGERFGSEGSPLAVTTLSLAAPLVLLNAELGDHGILRRRRCDCAMGRAGLDRRIAAVHSPAKIAAEGVKLGDLDFAALVEEAVCDLGGNPDDFQIWLDGDSADRPAVVLSPVAPLDAAALRARLRQMLPRVSGGALAVHLWLDAGGMTIERKSLVAGAGHKMRRVIRRPLPAPAAGGRGAED